MWDTLVILFQGLLVFLYGRVVICFNVQIILLLYSRSGHCGYDLNSWNYLYLCNSVGLLWLLPPRSRLKCCDSRHSNVYTIEHYAILSLSDLLQAGCFSIEPSSIPVFTNNETDRHDIIEILLQVALYDTPMTHTCNSIYSRNFI